MIYFPCFYVHQIAYSMEFTAESNNHNYYTVSNKSKKSYQCSDDHESNIESRFTMFTCRCILDMDRIKICTFSNTRFAQITHSKDPPACTVYHKHFTQFHKSHNCPVLAVNDRYVFHYGNIFNTFFWNVRL